MNLLDLAARVEGASGPERSLDKLIREHIDPRHVLAMDLAFAEMRIECEKNGLWSQREEACRHHANTSPHYTKSLDAALSLVPEDMRDEIEITTLYQVARVGINLNHGPDGGPFYGSNESNSIPLAICAAALRARAGASS